MNAHRKLKKHLWALQATDAGLSVLAFVQCMITFVTVPLLATRVIGYWIMDVCLLISAIVCAIAFTRRRRVQLTLLGSLMAIVIGPHLWGRLTASTIFGAVTPHETISLGAFCFNLLVTALVARHVFGPGKVTGHRILGAVLIYINMAVLFSIAYDMLDTITGGAIRSSTGGFVTDGMGARIAELSYFSLTTITTCGYGDLVPVHPVARSLANLEAVFGALFPATFVARLVALHLAHSDNGNETKTS